ncbi:MAG: hypothetical protein SOR93_02030, partial [Clostridiales Family XIII bacterium]|nr:hypothetical protein [Clostridia bacterium]MDY3010029.1 hypothetical protein [Clostridiales Family XIII bacterium]
HHFHNNHHHFLSFRPASGGGLFVVLRTLQMNYFFNLHFLIDFLFAGFLPHTLLAGGCCR